MKNNRWLRLAIGAFALFFAGIIYAWSVIKAPFAAFGWTSSQLGLNYTITMSMFCLGGLFSGLLNKKISAKIRMAASGVLVAGGFALLSTGFARWRCNRPLTAAQKPRSRQYG